MSDVNSTPMEPWKPQPVADYLATLHDEAAFLYGNTDIGYSGSQEALSRHTEAVDRMEAEIALRDRLLVDMADRLIEIRSFYGHLFSADELAGDGEMLARFVALDEDGAADADSTGDLDADLQAQGFDPFGSGGAA